jgi:hypothetical protein
MAPRISLTFDTKHASELAEFWKFALGYIDEPPPAPFKTRQEWVESFDLPDDDDGDGAWLIDPEGVGPRLSLLDVPEPKTAKNRLHMDVRVSGSGSPDEQWAEVTAEVERLSGAGARVVHTHEGHHVFMADPEGNEFCVC